MILAHFDELLDNACLLLDRVLKVNSPVSGGLQLLVQLVLLATNSVQLDLQMANLVSHGTALVKPVVLLGLSLLKVLVDDRLQIEHLFLEIDFLLIHSLVQIIDLLLLLLESASQLLIGLLGLLDELVDFSSLFGGKLGLQLLDMVEVVLSLLKHVASDLLHLMLSFHKIQLSLSQVLVGDGAFLKLLLKGLVLKVEVLDRHVLFGDYSLKMGILILELLDTRSDGLLHRLHLLLLHGSSMLVLHYDLLVVGHLVLDEVYVVHVFLMLFELGLQLLISPRENDIAGFLSLIELIHSLLEPLIVRILQLIHDQIR